MALRVEAPEDCHGLVHGMGFYDSDDSFAQMFAPFCEAGLERGEPTAVRVDDHKADLLRSVLSAPDEVTFLPYDGQYVDPPSALTGTLELCDRLGANGKPLRLVGELPAMVGLSRDAWVRYEAAANHVLRGLRLRTVCPYDARATPEAVREEVLRTHHVVVNGDGVVERNARYEPPEAFLAQREHPVRDPLEEGSLSLEMVDPAPSAARQAVAALASDMRLGAGATDELLIGMSEVLANAILHGCRPIVLHGWGSPGRVVIAVRDRGPGPENPFAGLLPVEAGVREGGFGLRIAHQMCPETSLSATAEGFTVRLAAGSPL